MPAISDGGGFAPSTVQGQWLPQTLLRFPKRCDAFASSTTVGELPMTRRTSIFEDVMKLPWPVGVGMAAVVVLALQIYLWIAPAPSAQNGFSLVFRSIISWFAYGCAFLFVLGAFFSFLTQLIRGRRFKATQSIADIRSLSWRQFESYIGEMFRQDGYFVVETPEGPDNGVDLVLRKEGEKTYVQCKHWKANTVGVEKIRELLGSMAAGGAQAGIFVASGDYTQAAKDFARECGIRLIDGVQLAQLLSSEKAEPEPENQIGDKTSEVTCPLCNARMVQRVARRGRNKGFSFWGCSNYPDCRGTRQA